MTPARLIYAGLLVDLPVPDDQRRAGGVLMYYGGDTAELLLALALLTTWRPSRFRATARPPASCAPPGPHGPLAVERASKPCPGRRPRDGR